MVVEARSVGAHAIAAAAEQLVQRQVELLGGKVPQGDLDGLVEGERGGALIAATQARDAMDQRLRRLPVVNRSKQLVGILSLGDVALSEAQPAGKALAGISQPGGPHSQSDGLPA